MNAEVRFAIILLSLYPDSAWPHQHLKQPIEMPFEATIANTTSSTSARAMMSLSEGDLRTIASAYRQIEKRLPGFLSRELPTVTTSLHLEIIRQELFNDARYFDDIPEPGDWRFGYFIPPDTIYCAPSCLERPWQLKHELLHFVLHQTGTNAGMTDEAEHHLIDEYLAWERITYKTRPRRPPRRAKSDRATLAVLLQGEEMHDLCYVEVDGHEPPGPLHRIPVSPGRHRVEAVCIPRKANYPPGISVDAAEQEVTVAPGEHREVVFDWDDMENYWTDFSELKPPNVTPRILYNRGVHHTLNNKLRIGVAFFQECLELDPAFCLCERALGVAYAKQGDAEKTAHYYRRYIECDPGASEADQIRAMLKEYER